MAKLSYPAPNCKPVITGEWLHQDRLSGVVLATDASGGPHTKDPRLRRVAVAVVAYRWVGQELQQVASICCDLPGNQTIYRGELYAVALGVQKTSGPCDVTLDCLSVAKRLKSGKTGGKHEDIWHTISEEDGFARLRPFWIRSHLKQEQFDQMFGVENRWRFNANQTADALCGQFALELVDETYVAQVRQQDALAEQVLCFLTSRVELILAAKPSHKHPTNSKERKGSHLAKAGGASTEPCEVKVLPGVQRTCKKRVGGNVAPLLKKDDHFILCEKIPIVLGIRI